MFDTTLISVSVISLISSFILTAGMRHYVIRRQILDLPNTRSSHIVPTPRGGGLAFVIVFCAAISVLFYLNQDITYPAFNAILFGGLMIAVVGWVDDYFSLPVWFRLTIHLAVTMACLLYIGLPQIPLFGTTVSLGWLAYPIMAVLLTWHLNLFNFMDGIDGIAAVQAITTLSGALIILALTHSGVEDWRFAPYLFILLVSVLGFLVWNWPPAKIFMGDTASGFLGFVLGLFAVMTSLDNHINLWSWLILFGFFITDATVTLMVRIWRGERWHVSHRQHLYQRYAMNLQMAESVLMSPEIARMVAHRTVVFAVVAINTSWLLPLAIVATYYPDFGLAFTVVGLMPIVVVVLKAQSLGGRAGDTW